MVIYTMWLSEILKAHPSMGEKSPYVIVTCLELSDSPEYSILQSSLCLPGCPNPLELIQVEICSPYPQLHYRLACLHGGKEKIIFFFSLCMKTGWGDLFFHIWEDHDNDDQNMRRWLLLCSWCGQPCLGIEDVLGVQGVRKELVCHKRTICANCMCKTKEDCKKAEWLLQGVVMLTSHNWTNLSHFSGLLFSITDGSSSLWVFSPILYCGKIHKKIYHLNHF